VQKFAGSKEYGIDSTENQFSNIARTENWKMRHVLPNNRDSDDLQILGGQATHTLDQKEVDRDRPSLIRH
jgi:hypothetical protein